MSVNKAAQQGRGVSGKAENQILTDDIPIPCVHIIYRMPYRAVFLVNELARAQLSFLRIQVKQI